MKHRNIIALCLGIFAAALLWQYYLWPKYQINKESPEVMAMLEETAQRELENSIDSNEAGEILFVGEESSKTGQELSATPQKEEDLVFYSQANKPKDVFDLISRNDMKKRKTIILEKEDFVVHPSAMENFYSGEESPLSETARITMLKLPEEFLIIKDAPAYNKFLKEHKGSYPKVNFNKEQIVFVLSASKLSDSFFEIIKTENTAKEINIFYRINLISADEVKNPKNYAVIENKNLPIKFIQIK